jgi:hypothetical protein
MDVPESETASQKLLLPCRRCGTFIQGVPALVNARLLCQPCAALIRRRSMKLYPYFYMNAVGIIVNLAMGGAMAAINWKRLGNKRRMWVAIGVMVSGLVWSVVFFNEALLIYGGPGLLPQSIPRMPYLLRVTWQIAGTLVATLGMNSAIEQHREAGGAFANRLWPVLLYFAFFMSIFTLSDIMRFAG